MKYEYQGTVFEVEFPYHSSNYYKIYDILEHGDVISFPETIDGRNVEEFGHKDNDWDYHRKEKYILNGVRQLIVPATIDELSIHNYMFPNLEEIEVSTNNRKYSTDGKMLFSKDGTKLILALCAGMSKEPLLVPEHVAEVGINAFKEAKCQTIEFANKSVRIMGNPFEFSAWYTGLMNDNKAVYVGNMLFRAPDVDEFTVDSFVTRIHDEAFSKNIPKKLIAPVIPYGISEFTATYGNSPEELVITTEKKVNIRSVMDWKKLKSIMFLNNRYYKSIDGVVFSSDGKELLLYPGYRTDKKYVIPTGVKKIGKGAFKNQHYLENVHIPSSVAQINQGAFYGCKALKSIVMAPGLSVISDASVFQPQGVFENCTSLTSVSLSAKLSHIGAKAFSGCKKLADITIPEGVKSIGEYAFYDTAMQIVKLPKSLSYILDGALMTGDYDKCLEVYAYEGSARGLIPAIEAVEKDSLKKTSNLLWRPVRIHMLRGNGSESDMIVVPNSLKRSAGAFIDSAWNQPKFSYSEYYAIFPEIQDSEEKIKFAMGMIAKNGELEDSEYGQYIRRMSSRIALRMIEEKDEKGLISFIKKGYVSENTLKTLLGKCNKADLTTASAYILQAMNKAKRKGTAVIRL